MKKYSSKKSRTFRRRRPFKSRRKTSMNRMQKAAYSYVKKKYTTVIPIITGIGEESSEATISHIGGRNGTNPGNTATLFDANPDGM